MRYTIAALLFALAGTAAAEEVKPRTKTIGIDGGVAMPTGGWGDAAGFGIGALARFEMPLQKKLVLTARAGYIAHLEKKAEGMFGGEASSSTSEIPIFGGMRYAFTPKAYAAAELGLVHFSLKTEAGGMSSSGGDTNLGMSLGAGYRAGKLDVRGGLLFADIGEVGDSMALNGDRRVRHHGVLVCSARNVSIAATSVVRPAAANARRAPVACSIRFFTG
jgi:hypothetical protein